MKYSDKNKPLQCFMTQSTCYKGTDKMTVRGVLWHSTGANNPTLKRYVQPDDNASDRDELIALIGKNTYGNDWNHIDRQAGLNCWIGKLADGTVTTIQTMPWDFKPWGCGGGKNGSCNNGWVQFEICEDGLTDPVYFEKVYKEACEITAYICQMFGIDPNGTVTMNGVNVPTILCHADSYKLGLGSNHGDVNHWFPKHGKSMATARADVAALLKAAVDKPSAPSVPSSEGLSAGTKLTIENTPLYVSSTAKNKASSKTGTYYVWNSTVVNGRIRITNKTSNVGVSGQVTGWIDVEDAQGAAGGSTSFKPYLVKVTTDVLNIRKGAGTNYATNGAIRDKGTYTIVAEANGQDASKWGKLKSGAGWISLDYVKKV